LKEIDLQKKREIKAPYLSGWEKQRVAIARALITNPKFIIADEPTWNLDWENSKKIADLLIQVHNSWNTILLITHDMQLIYNY